MKTRKPAPSTVIASLALFFALGGSAVAAQHYLITSTNQIKPSVLAKLKGKDGPAGPQGQAGQQGLAGPQGQAGLQGPAGLRGPEGAPGPTGQAGPRGMQGEQGPPGPAGTGGGSLSSLTVEESAVARVPANNELGPAGFEGLEGAAATCPSGDRVVSGGSNVYAGVVAGMLSVPSKDHRSWIVVVANASTYGGGEVQAIAYCATAGNAIAARSPHAARLRALQETTRLMARMEARVQAGKR